MTSQAEAFLTVCDGVVAHCYRVSECCTCGKCCTPDWGDLMGWVLMVVGAGFLFAPGMIDPLAPINGLSLVGLLLVVWGTVRMNRTGTQ